MRSKILHFLAVCLVVFSGFAISGPSSLAAPPLVGASRPLVAATMNKEGTGSVESQRKTASKLEIPTGGEIGRQQVRETVEQADTRSTKEKRDKALKITPAAPGTEVVPNSGRPQA